jgi:hypothetical protein
MSDPAATRSRVAVWVHHGMDHVIAAARFGNNCGRSFG